MELRPAGMYPDAASTYRGRERWAQFGVISRSVWDEWHFDSDAFEFFYAGYPVAVFAPAVGKGKGSGVEVTQEEADIWTIRDGKIQPGSSSTGS